ncbi:MAG: hypothetical protein HND55_10060 [Pseudomonadota bacterium]|nr:MAG: hypothetical protein HND55_10060 [Pseudomonadota bacterium]
MIIRNPQLAWREIGDETVVIDLDANWMYGLSPSAGYLLRQMDDCALDPQHLLGTPGGTLDHERHSAWTVFIDELIECGLLVAADLGQVRPLDAAQRSALQEWIATASSPQLLWREEIRNFGQSGAFCPGQSAACDANPDPSC